MVLSGPDLPYRSGKREWLHEVALRGKEVLPTSVLSHHLIDRVNANLPDDVVLANERLIPLGMPSRS